MLKTKRISARLSLRSAEKLKALIKLNDSNMSQVIADAIDRYYQTQMHEDKSPYSIIKESGFIGVGEDAADASSNYKELLTKSLSKKYDHS